MFDFLLTTTPLCSFVCFISVADSFPRKIKYVLDTSTISLWSENGVLRDEKALKSELKLCQLLINVLILNLENRVSALCCVTAR